MSQPSSGLCELNLPLEPGRNELVRAFVRESSLADDVSAAAASLVADDAAAAWLALATQATGHERAHVSLARARGEIVARIRLQGHSRFSALVASLAGRLRPDAGVSHRERGIDGWEISLHRRLDAIVLPQTANDEHAPQPATAGDAEIQIGPVQQDDAASVARCFLTVYGHGYVHHEVYSPRRYWSKIESGELIAVVTRNGDGDIVGHVALERAPGAAIAERGEAVVLPAYRGRRLLETMTQRLSEEAQRLGLRGVFAMPVTVHTFSQRNDERAGMPPCAIRLGAAAESMLPRDLPAPTAGQRQSLLVAFRFLQKEEPRVVHIPLIYRDIVGRIYEWLGATMTVAQPAEPAQAQSRARVNVDTQAYGEIHFESIGANAPIELKQALQDITGLGARAVQLSARVVDPGLPLLIEAARETGFFFCGVGPCFDEGEDVLLLQLLREPLETGKLQIYAAQTKELLAFIDDDRASAGQKGQTV